MYHFVEGERGEIISENQMHSPGVLVAHLSRAGISGYFLFRPFSSSSSHHVRARRGALTDNGFYLESWCVMGKGGRAGRDPETRVPVLPLPLRAA